MDLGEFWETTPGEVMLVIFSAGERNLDQLELGVHQVWLGRLVSHMKHPDPRAILPRRRGEKPPAAGVATRDARYTAAETARWTAYFREQEKQKAGNA